VIFETLFGLDANFKIKPQMVDMLHGLEGRDEVLLHGCVKG